MASSLLRLREAVITFFVKNSMKTAGIMTGTISQGFAILTTTIVPVT